MKPKKTKQSKGLKEPTSSEIAAFYAGLSEGKKHHSFTKQQCDSFTESLSDFLCWIDGFRAGGGTYSPQSIEPLRDLNIKLKAMHGQSVNSQTPF